MQSGMKMKAVAAILLGVTIAGCGGGGGDDNDTSSTGTASTPQSTAPANAESEYLTQSYQTGQGQAQQSQAAAQSATDPAVRELAQQINTEITIINQQITNISQSANVTINNTLTNEQQVQVNNLVSLSGAEFDRTYVRNLINTTKSMLAATVREARQGSDLQARQTAVSNLLLIEQRLAIAEETLYELEPGQYLAGTFEDSLFEIELAQVAVQKATDPEVRQFAQEMITEHTELNTRITTLAVQKNISLPTATGPDKQEIVAMISAFSGPDFDRAYMDRNVLQHAQGIVQTGGVAEESSDVQVRAFAAQTLPVLQAHFQDALAIAARIRPSALYQLSQGLIAELQLAQLAQTRSGNEEAKTLGQTIARQNQATFVQLVQLAQQESAQLPLMIPPGQVQAALQFLRRAGADTQQIRSVISAQLTQSLQIAQSLQANSQPGASAIARTRVQALQNLIVSTGQPGATEAPGSVTVTSETEAENSESEADEADAGGSSSGGTESAVSDGDSLVPSAT